MKKALIIVLILLVLGAVGAFIFYKVAVPKMAAKAIVKGEYSAVIPQKVQKKIEDVRDTINHRFDEVIAITQKENITIEQLMKGIDEVEKKEVLATYKEVISKQVTDPEKIFNIAYKHIKIEAFDPMVLKETFLSHAKPQHIKRGLQFAEKNKIMESLDMQMARSVAKQILREKQKEIEEKTGMEL